MLEIVFYPGNGQEPCSIDIASDVLRWLAESDFVEIGADHPTKIHIDGEEAEIPLVKLGQGNRKRLRDFFREAISYESDNVLHQLGDSPSKKEVQAVTYKLKKLLELLKCVENENYQYLQRV